MAITISDKAGLQAINDDLTESYVLGANIDCSGGDFTPIGDYSGNEPFTGTFDGKGFTISNLTVNGGDYSGLFGYVYGGTLSNIRLTSCNVSGSNYTGALVGYAVNAIISRCFASGVVASNSGYAIGGLIGYASESSIEFCGTDVGITNNGDDSEVGGLIGGTYLVAIKQSCAYGNVSAGDSYGAGGLIGYCYDDSVLSDCFAVGAVAGNDTHYGGLVGSCDGDNISISNCYSAGAVADGSDPNYSGGLVGALGAGTYAFAKCFWDTETSGQGDGIGWGSSGEVVGKTTAQMKTKSTFTDADWDFETVWRIGVFNNGYPYLIYIPTVETVETAAANPIGDIWAVLNATLTGGPAWCGFQIGTSSGNYNLGTAWYHEPITDTTYAVGVPELTAETTYYFRAIATDFSGIYYGSELNFTTIATPATFRNYTLIQQDHKGRPIFLAEAKAIDAVYSDIVYETQYTDNGIANFTKLPADRVVDIEVRWGRQYRKYFNVFDVSGHAIGAFVAKAHTQNTDDYNEGVQVTTEPATPSAGYWYKDSGTGKLMLYTG